MSGYDEYSDLICLKKNAKNTKFVKKVLADNNNPSFLPSEWFKYRVKFARNVISSTNNLELKTAYNIIASSGYLTGEDYYVQQFLSGFIAFLLLNWMLIFIWNCKELTKKLRYTNQE